MGDKAEVGRFLRSIPLIKSLVKLYSNQPFEHIDDCIQECWFTYCEAMKKATIIADNPNAIFAYLKIWYRHTIWGVLRKTCPKRVTPMDERVDVAVEPEFDLTSIDLGLIFTQEQLQIIALRLEGYENSEITDIISPNNNYKSKKSKDVFTYRRMVPIKVKLAQYLGRDYKKPKLDREI